MRFLSLFSLWLASVAFGDELITSSEAARGCAQGVHIIATRGNGTAQGYGIMIPMVIAIKNAIPHSTNISVSYPKTGSTPEGNTPGTEHQKRLISEHTRRCPKTPIVLVGYSEGAGLTLNTMCGTTNPGFQPTRPLADHLANHVLAVVVYGDYTHVSHQIYDRGNCTNSSPYPRGNPSTCHPVAHKIRSFCHAGDPVCCSTGNDKHEHYTYFKQYDTRMSNWVKKRFHEYKHGRRN